MADPIILFDDYQKVVKGLKLLDTGLDAELKKGLKAVGAKVATKAQAEAERKGLRATGELIKLIKPSATNKAVSVAATAKRKFSNGSRGSRYANKPFAYPSVYEYGGRGKVNTTGPRAFLRPGLRKAGPAIQEEMLQVINQTVSKAGFK